MKMIKNILKYLSFTLMLVIGLFVLKNEIFVSKMESILPENRNLTKAGDRHVTGKVLIGFLGCGAETDDQNIIVMTEFIEEVLPDYIKTFTEEGCETLLGDTYLKFLYGEAFEEEFYAKFLEMADSIQKSTLLVFDQKSNFGGFLNFRRIGNSPYLKFWALYYIDIEQKFSQLLKFDKEETNLVSLKTDADFYIKNLERITDLSSLRKLRTVSKQNGVLIPSRSYSDNLQLDGFHHTGLIRDQCKKAHFISLHLILQLVGMLEAFMVGCSLDMEYHRR